MATEIKQKDNQQFERAVGRRRTASARVRLYPEKGGEIIVNGKPFTEYFGTAVLQQLVTSPLEAVGKREDLKIVVKVEGGGKKGQAEAVRHGIARALLKWNEDFRKSLKTQHHLTRDPRKKERKKPGLKKARKAPQWSKR